MKCVYCRGELFLQKEETITKIWYWRQCNQCHARTPRGLSISSVTLLMGKDIVFENNAGQILREGDEIKCLDSASNRELTGELVFDEVALCYVIVPLTGARTPLWQCMFIQKLE